MKYSFDEIIDRKNTNSLKWDVTEDELPMWVADMDFQTAPEVLEAIQKRAAHGIFGYSSVTEEWKQAIASWWENRHHFRMEKEWIVFCTGVVPAISSIVRKITTVNENVVIMTPVYNIFYNCIQNNGRRVLESPLLYDGKQYSINWEDLEQKLANPQTSLLLLCNPQNPSGKIWEREALEKIGQICHENHVIVLADEIHCDLTDPGKEYIPFASVSEMCCLNSITCIAPTKAFNIAGLQTAAVSVPDKILRHRVSRALNTDEVAEPNAFAIDAAIAAFTKGGNWLDALCAYLYENKKLVYQYLEQEIPDLSAVQGEATYLIWIDCHKISHHSKELASFLRQETGLYLSAGEVYGGNGNCFLRLNAACPKKVLEDGLERLKRGCSAWKLFLSDTK